MVDAIDNHLIAALDDPLTFAYEADTASRPSLRHTPAPIKLTRIGPHLACIAITDQSAYRDTAFLTRLSQTIDSLGEADRLIVDARWSSTDVGADDFPGDWLRLWADSSMLMGRRVSRQHLGWTENPRADNYQEHWLSEAPTAMAPVERVRRRAVRTPTVVLVNRTSYMQMEYELDALQSVGAVKVALEKRGAPSGDFILSYPGGLRVRMNAAMLVSRSGSLGSRPDFVTAEPIRPSDLPALTDRLLDPSARPPRPPAFSFSIARPSAGPQVTNLNRIQRLHDVFLVWTVIEHLYPDRDVISDWPRQLPAWIAQAEAADTPRAFWLVLQRMATTLNDGHGSVSGVGRYAPQTDSAFAAMIPARLARVAGGKIAVVQLARVDDPSAPDGRSLEANPFKLGDEVVRIDGKAIDAIAAEWPPLIPSSTPGHLERELSMQGYLGTLGPARSRAHVEVQTAGGTRTIDVARNHRGWGSTLKPPGRLEGNIGYLPLRGITDSRMLDSLEREFQNTDGLVIDDREYGYLRDGFMPYLLEGWLWDLPMPASSWEVPVADFQHGVLNIGRAKFQSQPFVPSEYNTTGAVYRKPLVVLIGPLHSEPESIPRAIRDTKRGLLIGTGTGGMTGNADVISLPGGGRFQFTGMTILNPDGTRYNRVGVLPDVPVESTVEGLRAGRDEVLDAGIAALRQLIAAERAKSRD